MPAQPPPADTAPADPPPPSRPPRRRWWRDLLLLLLAFLVIQWWQTRSLVTGPAPPLAGITVAGAPFDLHQDRSAPVLVYFWGTWCPMCRLMQGTVDGLARDHRVIGVALGDDATTIRAALDAADSPLAVLPDPDGALAERWGVIGVPTWFVVDRQGRIASATRGLGTGWGLRVRLWLAGFG